MGVASLLPGPRPGPLRCSSRYLPPASLEVSWGIIPQISPLFVLLSQIFMVSIFSINLSLHPLFLQSIPYLCLPVFLSLSPSPFPPLSTYAQTQNMRILRLFNPSKPAPSPRRSGETRVSPRQAVGVPLSPHHRVSPREAIGVPLPPHHRVPSGDSAYLSSPFTEGRAQGEHRGNV